MNFRELKIRIIILVAVISLGVLFGARFAYEHLFLGSLKEAFLSIDGVADLKVERGQQTILVVTLERVERLETTYGAIRALAEERLGNHWTVELVDQRNGELVERYHQLHYALWQAISTGDFVEMADRVEAVTQGLDARITVDRDFIYVELETEDGYLYEIMPRQGGQAS